MGIKNDFKDKNVFSMRKNHLKINTTLIKNTFGFVLLIDFNFTFAK